MAVLGLTGVAFAGGRGTGLAEFAGGGDARGQVDTVDAKGDLGYYYFECGPEVAALEEASRMAGGSTIKTMGQGLLSLAGIAGALAGSYYLNKKMGGNTVGPRSNDPYYGSAWHLSKVPGIKIVCLEQGTWTQPVSGVAESQKHPEAATTQVRRVLQRRCMK